MILYVSEEINKAVDRDGSDLDKELTAKGGVVDRRTVLQLAATGITVPGLATGSVTAEESFIDILSIDPSNYPYIHLNLNIDTPAGQDGLLTKDDFEIIENGIQKEIQSFEFGSTKSDIVFVFDDTGSMGGEIDAMKSEVSDLVSEIEAAGIDSQYGLVTFKDNVEVDLELTDNASALQDSVDDLSASGGGDFPEDNFDAIMRALEFDFRTDAQKVIVDITDALSHYKGDSSGISDHTLDDVAAELTDSGIAYIAVSPGYENENAAKKVLADEVGGTWININDANFTVILEEITELVVTAYVIEYVTDLAPGVIAPISVIVDDPDEGTGRVDDEIDVPTDVEDDYLRELIEEKQNTIGNIQSFAAKTIGDDEASSRVDKRAEELLDDIQNNEFEASGTEYTEAVERMIATEDVTHAATDTVTGNGSPTQTNIENLFSLTKGLAVELLSGKAGGKIRDVANSIVSSVTRKFDDLLGSFSGRGIIPSSTADSVSHQLNRATTQSYFTLKGFANENPDKTEDIVEAAEGSLSAVESTAGILLDELDENRGIIDNIERQYFYGYYFDSGWPEVNIPAPDKINLPELDISYDVPDEDLGYLSRVIPDKIEYSYEPPSLDLPDELETLVEVLNEVEDLVGSGGIGTTIDERIEDIDENLESLNPQDEDTRSAVSSGLSAGISAMGEATEIIIDALENLQSLLQGASDIAGYVAIAAALAGAVTAATGVGPLALLSAAAVLAKVSGVLSVIAVGVDGVQIGVGQDYLSNLTTIHQQGTYALAETRLGGVDL